MNPEKLPKEFKEKWGVPQELGDAARDAIKGHSLDFYLNILRETRDKTLSEFRKRDDKWLAAVDKTWLPAANGSMSPNTKPTTTARSSS